MAKRAGCVRAVFVRRDADGNAVELAGVVLDITRQKELDAERRRVLERAQDRARIFDTALAGGRGQRYEAELS